MQINVGMVTVSDRASKGEYEDLGGPALKTAAAGYGWSVIADLLVPDEQVMALKNGIRAFLLASQLTLVDTARANATFQQARDLAASLPEPAATVLTYVNNRNVKALGPLLEPHIGLEADPAASPERAPAPPSAPVFLLHGNDDVVIPAAESVVLANRLREQGVDVRLLLSRIITHAELDRAAAISDSWQLIAFWAEILQR